MTDEKQSNKSVLMKRLEEKISLWKMVIRHIEKKNSQEKITSGNNKETKR